MTEKKYYKQFASCIPVKGASKSTIFDLQRNEFYKIDNEVCADSSELVFNKDSIRKRTECGYNAYTGEWRTTD